MTHRRKQLLQNKPLLIALCALSAMPYTALGKA